MLKIYVMASHGYLPAIVFHPEQGLNRVPKDCQRLLPNPELRQDFIRSGSLGMRPHHDDEPWKPRSGLFDNNQFVNIDPTITRPVLIDVQDTRPKSTLSLDVAKQAPKRAETVKFLMPGLSLVERDGLYHLQGSCFPDVSYSESRFMFPNVDFDSPKPLMDFIGDLVRRSEVTFHEDGRVLLTSTGTGIEMKDVLLILAEIYLAKNSTNWRKHSALVPQFNRLDCSETSYYGSSLGLGTATFAPTKSPEKVKPKPSPKKKSTRNKTVKDKDQHRTNCIQACESLLSIIVDKNRNGKAAIPVLKKSGPELPNLLTQFSASIAGTGLAVLFSVMCKLASGRVPFCTSKLLNTGLGLGLVWLSGAVNRLRDTIVNMSKKSNKKGLKEEEMMKNLDTSVKEIYFRAATLMAVMVLRLA